MRAAAGITVVVLAVLSAGCGGTQSVGAGASDVVPADAAVYLAIDTDPGSSQWKTVDALAGRFPDKQKGVDAIKKSLGDSLHLSWEKDVKPALGTELDFAWLDLDHNGQDFVALVQPKDEGKFKTFVDRV